MTEGIRTPDTRDHNPVLYLLSYGHHDATPPTGSPGPVRVPDHDNPTYSWVAIPFAWSTSGPGGGTKMVFR